MSVEVTSHPLQCQCGTIKGAVANPGNANRCVCYCRDCQAFAHFQHFEIVLVHVVWGDATYGVYS